MNKIKLLTFAVIGLLLLNLATLSFLFLNAPGGNHHKPQEIIIEKLHFDENQQRQYKQIIQWHRGRINDLDEKFKQTKENLYHLLLASNVDEKKKDSLISALANYQREIEITHFKHFQEIKKLCKKEQLKDFDYLTTELSRIFSPPPKPRKD
jgi:Spy/CpxP family protein refolding chaperone